MDKLENADRFKAILQFQYILGPTMGTPITNDPITEPSAGLT